MDDFQKQIDDINNQLKDFLNPSVGDPQNPQFASSFQQAINLPYTTKQPTWTPRLNGYRTIYFDGGNYWLYVWANGAWRSQQLGSGGGSSGVTSLSGTGITVSSPTGIVALTVSDATISTSDITTNNVSTSKHGFAPKAPNDATKFLDGTGAYSVPVSASIAYKSVTSTRNLSTASGSETIAHGLGKTPSFVRADANLATGNAIGHSHGAYDGTTQNYAQFGWVNTGSSGSSSAGTNSIIQLYGDSGSTGQIASITVDATNINVTWTKVGGGSGSFGIIWEVEA